MRRAHVLAGSALAALSLTAAACGSSTPATGTGHTSNEQHMMHSGSTTTESGSMMHSGSTTTESGSMMHETTTTG